MNISDEIFAKVAEKIISSQEGIIGPVAVEEAQTVEGLVVDWKNKKIDFLGDHTQIIEKLIEKYRDFFGQVSVEVCREAVKKLISEVPKEELPQLLK
jgi:hypothetical protein